MDLGSMKFAHDLKMPIQLIYSCIQLLEMEISPNARVEGYLQMLMKSADQLQSMVTSALDAPGDNAPDAQGSRKIRDVVELARSISRQCALYAAERGIRLHFETNAAAFRMSTDVQKLERILQNLLSNALRFTPEGGHVALAVRVWGDAVEFTVSDSGCGIEEDRLDTIFDLGVTEGGHGYGLAIVKEYASLLGGDISVQSRKGWGSSFTVHLPVRAMRTLA